MSARDDYLIERNVIYEIDPGRWQDMCDEIDRLRTENVRLQAEVERLQERAVDWETAE